jgi:hypothetical protein
VYATRIFLAPLRIPPPESEAPDADRAGVLLPDAGMDGYAVMLYLFAEKKWREVYSTLCSAAGPFPSESWEVISVQ